MSRPEFLWIKVALLCTVFLSYSHLFGKADPGILVQPGLFESLKYRLIGPYRGGRVTAGTGVPSKPFTFYMGSTGGGVWRTDDAGETWINISDGFIEAGSIGAIAVAPSDSNVVYVGTGSNAPRGNVSPGIGAYRSTDGGDSWHYLGLPEAGQIGRIRIHPSDPDLVYVAALGHIFGSNQERGVFRSKNGGKTWEKVLYVSKKTGAVDLAMDHSNPRILYAAMWTAHRKPWDMVSGSEESGLYKTADGGDTWEKLAGGLPEGVVGKIGVSVSRSNPDRVWALVEAEEGGVFRSDDSGKNWKRQNKERKLRQRAWYYTRIYADPIDADTIYALNTSFYKSVDGGKTFEAIQVRHGDCHDLWINPSDNRILLQTNDGGAHVSLNGGKSWSTLHNQPTAEIYRIAVDNQFPYLVYGSQQDNSTISVPSRNPGGLTPYQHWFSVGGCESGHIAVDPRDPDIVFAGCYGGAISRTDVGSFQSRSILVYPQLQLGQAPKDLNYRFQWNAPIRLSPHDPDVLYHASQILHRSTDQGYSWTDISPDLTLNDRKKQDFAGGPITRDNTGVEVFGTIFAFEESPLEPGLLWVGSDDGLAHVSLDNGRDWKDITPSQMPDWATVNMIEPSRHKAARAYMAVHRYRLDDFQPYVFRTNDYGRTWQLLTGESSGIPQKHFTRVVREDPIREGLLYLGTEFGLYVSFDGGAHWQSLQLNLPITPVTDLAVHQGNLVVATQGRSIWILDHLNVLREVEPSHGEEPLLFTPAPAYRASFRQTPQDSGSRVGSSPPNGAVIHYYLPKKPEGQVRVEILDQEGSLIRSYVSDSDSKPEGSGEASADQEEKDDQTAPAEQELNQLVWNLRYPRVKKTKDAVVWGFTGGPMALPGRYEVRLSVENWSGKRLFEVLEDPRSSMTGEELREQFRIAMEIRDELNRVYAAIDRARSARSQVQSLINRLVEAGYGEELKDDAKALVDRLETIEGRFMQRKNESNQDPLNFQPMLDNQLVYLYGYVANSDGRPTRGAEERLKDLKTTSGQILRELEQLIERDLSDFERSVSETGAPRIIVRED